VIRTGSKFGPNGVKIWAQKSIPKWVKKSDQNEVKIWSKRGQILTSETDDQKLGSRNDIREHSERTPAHAISNVDQEVVVSSSWSLFVDGCAWWVCGNLWVDFVERNCSVAKIVGRNPDDSGQVTVNQRTTTPLFKVIIRDS